MSKPPDDRARQLAKEALEQVKRLEILAAFCGDDSTEAQEIAISLAIRNYSIERLEALKFTAAEEQAP